MSNTIIDCAPGWNFHSPLFLDEKYPSGFCHKDFTFADYNIGKFLLTVYYGQQEFTRDTVMFAKLSVSSEARKMDYLKFISFRNDTIVDNDKSIVEKCFYHNNPTIQERIEFLNLSIHAAKERIKYMKTFFNYLFSE